MRKLHWSFILLLLVAGSTLAEEMTDAEIAVWQQEDAYYEYARNNDPDGYLSLFHEDIIGWPTLDPAPKGKANVSQWIGYVHADPEREWHVDYEPLVSHSHGNVVVVHYRLMEWFELLGSDQKLDMNEYRISHTWLYENGRWQIISGMGGRFNQSPLPE